MVQRDYTPLGTKSIQQYSQECVLDDLRALAVAASSSSVCFLLTAGAASWPELRNDPPLVKVTWKLTADFS